MHVQIMLGSRADAFRAGRTFVMTVANACTALFSTSTSSAAKLVMPTPSAQGQACWSDAEHSKDTAWLTLLLAGPCPVAAHTNQRSCKLAHGQAVLAYRHHETTARTGCVVIDGAVVKHAAGVSQKSRRSVNCRLWLQLMTGDPDVHRRAVLKMTRGPGWQRGGSRTLAALRQG